MLYYDHDDKVNGAVVEKAIKSAINKKIEGDKEEIEDCGLTVEEVKSDFTFLNRNNRERIEDLKRELEDEEELNIEWDCEGEDDDYEGDCRWSYTVWCVDDIPSEWIIEEIKSALQFIDAMVEKMENHCRDHIDKIDEVEVFGGVASCAIYKDRLKELLKNTERFISFS